MKQKFHAKKVVRLAIMLLCIGAMCCLVGCSKKEAITKAEFAKTMDSLDYQVEDQSKMIVNQDFDVMYLARPHAEIEKAKEDASYKSQHQVEFYQFKDSDACEKAFDKSSDELVQAYKEADGYKSKSKTKSNYGYRWVETEKLWYQISYVDDTIVVGVAPLSEKADLQKTFEKLGY